MLASMTALDLRRWEIYEQIEPFGERAAYWRAGMVASVFANCSLKKGAAPFKAEDFMPKTFHVEKPVKIRAAASQIAERFKIMADREKLTRS